MGNILLWLCRASCGQRPGIGSYEGGDNIALNVIIDIALSTKVTIVQMKPTRFDCLLNNFSIFCLSHVFLHFKLHRVLTFSPTFCLLSISSLHSDLACSAPCRASSSLYSLKSNRNSSIQILNRSFGFFCSHPPLSPFSLSSHFFLANVFLPSMDGIDFHCNRIHRDAMFSSQ